jgi:hypothetical protein
VNTLFDLRSIFDSMNYYFCGLESHSWLAIQRFEERNAQTAGKVKPRGKATGPPIWRCSKTSGHQRLSKTAYSSSSHKSSPKQKSRIGFFEGLSPAEGSRNESHGMTEIRQSKTGS